MEGEKVHNWEKDVEEDEAKLSNKKKNEKFCEYDASILDIVVSLSLSLSLSLFDNIKSHTHTYTHTLSIYLIISLYI